MGYKKVKKNDGTTVIIGTGKGSQGIKTNLGNENQASKLKPAESPSAPNPYSSTTVDGFSSLADKYAKMSHEEARNESVYELILGANPYLKSSYRRRESGGMLLSIQKERNPVDTSYDGTPHKLYLTAFEHQKLSGGNETIMSREQKNARIVTFAEEIEGLKNENDQLNRDKIVKQNKADIKGWVAATLGGGSAGAAATVGTAIMAGGLLPMTIPIAAAVFAAVGGFTKVAMRNKANTISNQIDLKIEKNKEEINNKEQALNELINNTITPEEYNAKYS